MTDCKNCPDSAPGFTQPDNPKWTPKGLPEGLPECRSREPLIDTDEMIFSKSWAIYTGGSPESHLVMIITTIPEDFTRVTMQPDGNIEYEKGQDGWEPPRPIDGYVRDPDNQWLFHPIWKSCRWRQYGTVVMQQCQCLDVIARCSLTSCWVKSAECSNCLACSVIKPRPTPKKKTIQSLRLPDLGRSSK